MEHRKAQLMNWFIALILILYISIAYFVMTKPFQYVDQHLSPMVNITTPTQDGQEVINKIRMYWVVWPILILAFIILWAFFSSLRQDPNFPYQ